jgi:hypothetical protein
MFAMQPSQEARGARTEARFVWLAYAAACGALGLSGVFPVNNPDTFGHLAQGRQIVELGHVPLRDTLSFWQPQPMPWHNYEWLSDLAVWKLYALGGFDALIAAKCALLLVSAALIVGLAQALGGPRAAMLSAVLVVAAIPAARFRLTERPHLVALPLTCFYLIAFAYLMRAWGRARARVDLGLVAALGAAHLLWVNLHGSHLLGLALTCVHLVFALVLPGVRGKLALVLGLQLAASCVSPYGPAILLDAIAHVVDPAYRLLVSEWAPWQPTDPLWLLLAPILQTLGLAAVAGSWLRRGAAGRALLASTCLLALSGFRSIRFVAEYLMLSAPALAVGLELRLRAVPWRRFATGCALGLAALAPVVPWACTRLPPFAGIGHGVSIQGLPAASGQWLAAHTVQPRVLAAIEDSWYLMFAVPQARFLIDGRVPFFGPEHLQRVNQAYASPDHLSALLQQYRVDTVVVRHTFKPQHLLLQSMQSRPDWVLVFVEDRYAVFVRRDLVLRGGAQPRAIGLLPGYEPEWLLSADAVTERAILAELDRLPAYQNTQGYRGWVRGVLGLKPLRRDGGDSGLRAPVSASETAKLREVARWLARAARGGEGVPVVSAYHALVAAALCDLDTAERALGDARWEGDSRETLLGAQEIALRRGRKAEVRDFLRRAKAMPRARTDAWLAALRKELAAPPLCQ